MRYRQHVRGVTDPPSDPALRPVGHRRNWTTPYDHLMTESTLWSGKTLRQWLPIAVDDVVREVAPQRIVLFESVHGDEVRTATSNCSLSSIASNRAESCQRGVFTTQ